MKSVEAINIECMSCILNTIYTAIVMTTFHSLKYKTPDVMHRVFTLNNSSLISLYYQDSIAQSKHADH